MLSITVTARIPCKKLIAVYLFKCILKLGIHFYQRTTPEVDAIDYFIPRSPSPVKKSLISAPVGLHRTFTSRNPVDPVISKWVTKNVPSFNSFNSNSKNWKECDNESGYMLRKFPQKMKLIDIWIFPIGQ